LNYFFILFIEFSLTELKENVRKKKEKRKREKTKIGNER
jgi:hypothetical protein